VKNTPYSVERRTIRSTNTACFFSLLEETEATDRMDVNQAFDEMMHQHISASRGERRAKLERGLGHGETAFLKEIWYPAVGHFNDVYPEWEVRDFKDGIRYLDIAYMPVGVKCVVEVQGYGPHARDIPRWRFKDLSLRHCYLVMDGWTILPVAFDLIVENPRLCQQLVLAFIGKFVTTQLADDDLNWLECEILRYARRMVLPFTPDEIRKHLRISPNYARGLLHCLVEKQYLMVASGKERARTFTLRN
jgi:hypothetical protein